MNKEKIRELANKVSFDLSIRDKNVEVITEWLEQNRLTGVTLTKYDLHNFADFLKYRYEIDLSVDYIVDDIETWIGESLSEPVVVGLTDEQVDAFAHHYGLSVTDQVKTGIELKKWLKTQTFAQPEVKEVPVGLSEKQVKRLVAYMNVSNEPLYDDIVTFLDTQTFVQPKEVSDEELRDSYQALQEDFNRVSKELEQLKLQQFTLDWSKAPEWANWLAQDANGGWYLYENKPVRGITQWGRCDKHDAVSFHVNPEWINTLQERPKPTPQVEFDVDYIYKNAKYSVQSVGKMRIGDDWVECVTYVNDDYSATYTRTLSDFLAKFERVE